MMTDSSAKHAYQALENGEYGHAFGLFLLQLQSSPNNWQNLKFDFLVALDSITEQFLVNQKWKDLFWTYEQTMTILPFAPDIPLRFATLLYRNHHPWEAACYFRKTLIIDPDCTAALEGIETVCNMLVERWHFRMLNDKLRNEAFRNGISRVIERNNIKRVLDIGSGTGILSMIAVDAGASDVISCELSDVMCSISEDVFKVNNKTKKIKLLKKHSTKIKIPEDISSKVDLIISETFDSGLLGEHILQNLCHAQEMLMNKSAIFIPQKAQVIGCLIQSKYFRKQQRLLHCTIGNVDLKNFSVIAAPQREPYSSEKISVVRGGYDELCEPFIITDILFNDSQKIKQLIDGMLFSHDVRCCTPGIIDALVFWFDLYVDEASKISTSPVNDSCWEQALFPVVHVQENQRSLLKVEEGCKVAVSMKCQEHFKLENISVFQDEQHHGAEMLDKHSSGINAKLKLELMKLDPLIIEELNNHSLYDAIFRTLELVQCQQKMVIDIMKFPIGGLMSLKLGATFIGVMTSEYDDQLKRIASANGIDLQKIKFYNDIEDFNEYKNEWDILIVDPVDHSGVLRHRILEDIGLLKFTCLRPDGIVIPDQVAVYSGVIQSQVLLEQSKIVDNENTLSYKIAEQLNQFQAYTHLDIDLRTLSHEKLSQPIPIIILDLNEPFVTQGASSPSRLPSFLHQEVNINIKIIKEGTISAMPYWFMMKMCNHKHHRQSSTQRTNGHARQQCESVPRETFRTNLNNPILASKEKYVHYNTFGSTSNVLSTIDMGGHWKQAAILLNKNKNVYESDIVNITASCDKSCIRIKFTD